MTANPSNKTQILHILLALAGFEGFLLLIFLVSAKSTGENAVLFGLSAPSVALAGLLLSGAVLSSGIGLSGLRPSWRNQPNRWCDRLAACPEKLLTLSALLLLAGLVFPVVTVLLFSIQAGRVFERIAPVAGWVSLVGVQTLLGLWWSYREIYRGPGFFTDTPRKISRVIFAERPGLWAALGMLLVSAAAITISASISRGQTVGHDSGIFLYFGQQILKGDLLFRDLWDHKPPLIFYIDALGLLFGRGSLWGVWLLELISLSAGGLLGFFALRKHFSGWAAFFAMAGAISHIRFFLEGGNLTEEFALPLQWAALFLAFDRSTRIGFNLRAMLIGVLFAVALSLKQTMIGIWIALALYLVVYMVIRRDWRLWRGFALAAAGALVVVVSIVIFFAAQGALYAFWSTAYEYNFLYSDITPGQRLWAFGEMLDYLLRSSPFFVFTLAAWLIGFVIAVRSLWRNGLRSIDVRHPAQFALWVGLINLPIEFLLINSSGKNYRHYFLSLLPGMSILAAWGFGLLWTLPGLVKEGHLDTRLFRSIYRTSIALLLSGLYLWLTLNQVQELISAPKIDQTTHSMVEYLQDETEPGDYVLMWGSQTTVNFLADRASPTRFVHQKPLFRAGYTRPEYVDEFLNDLQTKRPVLIINTHLPATPFIQTTDQGTCRLPATELPAGMETVFTYICNHYRLETVLTKDQWEVYRIIE